MCIPGRPCAGTEIKVLTMGFKTMRLHTNIYMYVYVHTAKSGSKRPGQGSFLWQSFWWIFYRMIYCRCCSLRGRPLTSKRTLNIWYVSTHVVGKFCGCLFAHIYLSSLTSVFGNPNDRQQDTLRGFQISAKYHKMDIIASRSYCRGLTRALSKVLSLKKMKRIQETTDMSY